MSSTVVGGDLVLAARPVTAESFAPYGRLLGPGDRVRLGGRGSVLLALDTKEAGPRRVKTFQRFADAKRVLLGLSEAAMILVVCGRGDAPAGPAAAFRVPGGTGVVLDAGVWHAGPLPLGDGPLLEALETVGSADRLDRRSVPEVLGAEGLRIMLSDEYGAPGPGLDLHDDYAVRIADGLRGRLSLGCLAFDRLSVTETDEALRQDGERLAHDLRVQWAERPPSEIPGLEPVRALYRGLGIDPTKTRPSSESLLRRVLQGKPLYRVNALVDALNLCSLRMLVPFGAYDRSRVAGPVVLRSGAAGEGYEGIGRGRIAVEGRPVLADREGPFGNPTADSLRTAVSHATTRAFVVLYLPPTMAAAEVAPLLDAVSAAVVRHCGGEETARRSVS